MHLQIFFVDIKCGNYFSCLTKTCYEFSKHLRIYFIEMIVIHVNLSMTYFLRRTGERRRRVMTRLNSGCNWAKHRRGSSINRWCTFTSIWFDIATTNRPLTTTPSTVTSTSTAKFKSSRLDITHVTSNYTITYHAVLTLINAQIKTYMTLTDYAL